MPLERPKDVDARGQGLRARHLGHRDGVLGAVLPELERGDHAQQWAVVLEGVHAARGERAAVAEDLDLEANGLGGVTRPEKIAVEGVDVAILVRGVTRGDHALAEHLAAEDAPARHGERVALERGGPEPPEGQGLESGHDGERGPGVVDRGHGLPSRRSSQRLPRA